MPTNRFHSRWPDDVIAIAPESVRLKDAIIIADALGLDVRRK
ncbi:hypothetical protein [Ensifer sp. ENS03]|nr:hypothetical protein [Ensifer sp. ENS03]